MRLLSALALVFGLVAGAFGAQTPGTMQVDSFCGINDTDAGNTIADCAAKSALNVETNLGSSGIMKRGGYTQQAALTIASAPVTGSTYFKSSSGAEIVVVCHSRYCSASQNGGAFSVIMSTASPAVTQYSFVAQNGILYAADDQHDAIWSYNGTSTSTVANIPACSILGLTQDRMICSNTTANPNRTNYSKSGDFTIWATGVNAPDPFNDDLGTPGDQLTGVSYWQGVLYYFKQFSVVACIPGDQWTTQCTVLTNITGTSDSNSIVQGPDGLYFKGSDQNFWKYDGRNFAIISLKIQNTIKTFTYGSTGQSIQTVQADWQAGNQTPTSSWNTTSISGSVFPSSITLVDTSSTSFAAGTIAPALTTAVAVNSIQFSSASYLIRNGDFATGDTTFWTCTAAGPNTACGYNGAGAGYVYAGVNGGTPSSAIKILDQNDNVLYTDIGVGQATCNTGMIDLAALGISSQTMKLGFFANGNGTAASLVSSTFTAISSITFSCSYINAGGGSFGTIGYSPGPDDVKVNRYFSMLQSSATQAAFTSRIQDTTFASPVGGPFVVGVSSPPGTTLPFSIRSSTSPNNDMWGGYSSISSGTRITEVKRYWQYISTFTTAVGTSTPRIDDVNLPAATTGAFVTQCITPPSTISGWALLTCDQSTTGSGALTYFSTSAVTCGGLPTSSMTTAGKWTATTNGNVITVATNTAFALRFDSSLVSSTDTAQVNACTINWKYGAVPPPVWGVYNPINNAIYWSGDINNSTNTNRWYKYDLNNQGWWPFDISAQATLFYKNSIYFGSGNGGYWNQYAPTGIHSDGGAAINSYWISKDWNFGSPFQEKIIKAVSLIATNQGTGSLTVTGSADGGASNAFSVNIGTSSTTSYIRRNYGLPVTSPFSFLNVQFANNAASNPWSVLGYRLDFLTNDWRVLGPP